MVAACARLGLKGQSVYATPYTFNLLAGLDGPPSGSVDGTGSAARIYAPAGLAVDGSGTIYLAESGGSLIRKITNGGVVTTLAGSLQGYGSADGVGTAASFYYPWGIAVDTAGNLYVADSGNDTIRKITPAGVVSTLAGTAKAAGRVDGAGSAARFDGPTGITVDALGNVYVCDSQNNAIRKVTSAGVVSTIAGFTGTQGSADGAANAASFYDPIGIAVDSSGNLFIGDAGNGTIRKITPSGVVSTLAGSVGLYGSTDGAGSNARFRDPDALAVDAADNIYVTDSGNETIRKITSGGVVTTIGGIAGTSGYASGSGSAALFQTPIGIAVDSAGNVYVSTYYGNVIMWGAAATPALSSPSAASAISGGSFSYYVAFTGAIAGPYTAAQLPAGLSINSNSGLISGVIAAGPGTYSITLSAVNAAGSGSGVLELNVSAPSGTSPYPQAPTGVGTSLDSATSANVSFTPPTSPGTTAISEYLVTATSTSGSSVTATGASSPIEVTGLAPGVVYSFTVTAINAAGAGPPSASESPYSLPVFSIQPTSLSVVAGASALLISSASGTPAPTYQWRFNGVNIGGATSQSLTLSSVQQSNAGAYVVVATNSSGSVSSNTAMLSVTMPAGTLPSFSIQPLSQTVSAGGAATFSASASGSPAPTYQWQFNGSNISGATGPALTLPNVQQSNAGTYVVVASNSSGNVSSNAATLSVTVSVSTVPSFTVQPTSQTITGGGTATLSASASGTPTPTFQWQVNGVNIPGATSSTYTTSLPGTYTVVITNSAGSTTSSPANVITATRLTNISTRAQVGTGGNLEIAGFVVSGAPGSTEQLLVRGVGPTLAQFGVTGVLTQPVLTLFNSSGAMVATNTGWGTNSNAAQIAATSGTVGAFALPIGSADSALLISLAPGAYTAQVSGQNTTTGVALAEVYEVNAGNPEIINVSTRAFVSTDSSVEIAGIVVGGSQSAKVLIRAVGPTLSPFGVAGVLAQPSLSVVNAVGTTVATNTGWSTNSNAATIASETAAIGTFSLPLGSADCALLLTLAPGSYTAVVSGVGGTSGVCLVEAYQAP